LSHYLPAVAPLASFPGDGQPYGLYGDGGG